MNRRLFLQTLAAAAAGAALDPERLLWQPGARTHILPPPAGWRRTETNLIVQSSWPTLRKGDVITIAGKYASNPITQQPTPHLQRFMVTEDYVSHVNDNSDGWHTFTIKPCDVTPRPEPMALSPLEPAAEYWYRGDRFPRRAWTPPLPKRDRRA